ncbi:MAG: potassium-transporting ATPase subunit F [Bacteroidales bacterium]|nr:potassium-transporting ATPase subunit F [Bacteroidales bacterium]
MSATILLVITKSTETNNNVGYIIAGIIALFILGYLIYTLFKPEKL